MTKIKAKGAYDYHRDWHQDASALVVPKVAQQVLLRDESIRDLVTGHLDIMDFMMLAKVPRSSQLIGVDFNGGEQELQNPTRYYVCVPQYGFELVKIMPPLPKKPDVYRRIGINSGYRAWPMNRLLWDEWRPDIDYDFYIQEVEKLVLLMR